MKQNFTIPDTSNLDVKTAALEAMSEPASVTPSGEAAIFTEVSRLIGEAASALGALFTAVNTEIGRIDFAMSDILSVATAAQGDAQAAKTASTQALTMAVNLDTQLSAQATSIGETAMALENLQALMAAMRADVDRIDAVSSARRMASAVMIDGLYDRYFGEISEQSAIYRPGDRIVWDRSRELFLLLRGINGAYDTFTGITTEGIASAGGGKYTAAEGYLYCSRGNGHLYTCIDGNLVSSCASDAPLCVVVRSDAGTVIGLGEDARVLTATVYLGEEDITEKLRDQDFKWRRISNDPAADAEWNAAHVGVGNQIVITAEEVSVAADFICEANT